MRLRIRYLTLFLILACPSHALDHDGQYWTGIYFQGPSDTSAQFFFEVQPRFASTRGTLQQILIRPAFGYKLNEVSTVWLGFAWTPTFDQGYSSETRFWQQYIRKGNWAAHDWLLRARLEQRRLTSGDLAWRLRTMARLSHAFWGTALSALIWDELFLNANSVGAGPVSGFDRNRLFLGIAWKMHERMALEAGYMNQYVSRPSTDLLTHNLITYFFITY